MAPSRITAVILDLDNCLAPADEVGRELLEPMFAAIARANQGTVSSEELDAAFAECWRLPLDAVAQRYGFSPEMRAAGWMAGRLIAVTEPMRGYPDLGALSELSVLLFVVTTGFRRLQESKIEALRLPNLTGAFVDAIDDSQRMGKEGLFREIAERHRLEAESVLVVGDNPESEIAAGNRLGMPTAQILRPGIERGRNATYYIHDLYELRRIVAGVPR